MKAGPINYMVLMTGLIGPTGCERGGCHGNRDIGFKRVMNVPRRSLVIKVGQSILNIRIIGVVNKYLFPVRSAVL